MAETEAAEMVGADELCRQVREVFEGLTDKVEEQTDEDELADIQAAVRHCCNCRDESQRMRTCYERLIELSWAYHEHPDDQNRTILWSEIATLAIDIQKETKAIGEAKSAFEAQLAEEELAAATALMASETVPGDTYSAAALCKFADYAFHGRDPSMKTGRLELQLDVVKQSIGKACEQCTESGKMAGLLTQLNRFGNDCTGLELGQFTDWLWVQLLSLCQEINSEAVKIQLERTAKRKLPELPNQKKSRVVFRDRPKIRPLRDPRATIAAYEAAVAEVYDKEQAKALQTANAGSAMEAAAQEPHETHAPELPLPFSLPDEGACPWLP